MGMKNPFMLKTVIGNTTFSLKADPGESFLVRDVWIVSPSANYVNLKIDRTLVGYFRCGGTLGSHLNMHRGRAQHSHSLELAAGAAITATNHQQITNSGGSASGLYVANSGTTDGDGTRALDMSRSGEQSALTLLGLLGSQGLFAGYPVAEGQTFVIDGVKDSDSIVMVQYEVHDAEDMSGDMPNGSHASEYTFVNYGNCGASIQATADNLFSTPKNPAEFHDFPYGKVVPPNYEITLLGILGSTFAPKENDGTDYSYTKYLKMVKQRETLFDEDRNGILFIARNTSSKANNDMIAEGWSPIGNYTDEDAKPPFLFPAPLVFLPGDELNIYVTLEIGSSGQALAIDEHEIGLITTVRRAA
ncbi:hypothetical protein LCGC14_1366810 [marine sediment metagenome]|uniref:Uncharacterized protein n=1 Tax=marine sediment metagenome TaxID=412755 RepID=A0A0F9K6K2_9ZZZZ